MSDHSLLLLTGNEVDDLLAHQEQKIVQTVAEAYQSHDRHHSSVPHSNFLLFPHAPANRIIALPAYLGESFEVAGIKWIASFPGNIEQGMERASAVLILNSMTNGRPLAILESSIISAKRTAASAALAAKYLRPPGHNSESAALVGCGLINFEILRFLLATRPALDSVYLYDLDQQRAQQFQAKCADAFPQLRIVVGNQIEEIVRKTNLVSLATTSGKPHIHDRKPFNPDTLILHISLRDLAPDIILAATNIVDDIDHVCRAQTSLHLAEQATGNRTFIHHTIGAVLNNQSQLAATQSGLTIFSPFGLGILDLAVAHLTYYLAKEKNCGRMIYNFLPSSWIER